MVLMRKTVKRLHKESLVLSGRVQVTQGSPQATQITGAFTVKKIPLLEGINCNIQTVKLLSPTRLPVSKMLKHKNML